MNNKKVLLGMSGGVDSSVSAILLMEQGYEVIGATMKLWDPEGETKEGCGNSLAADDAKAVCDILGIEHIVLDYREQFKKCVIDNFICTYQECKTPNPCVQCNKHLKFDLMFKAARERGIDYISTGHYAKVEYDEDKKMYVLKKSKSVKKDQSYVLYNIQKDEIGHVVFPLSDFETKDVVREVALKHGLDVANKPESQEICFIPDNNHIAFLERNFKVPMLDGDIVTKDGKVVGRHKGLHRYTIGQRKGLGIGGGTPYYVIRLDKEHNRLIVGIEEDLYAKECIAKDVNLLMAERIDGEVYVNAKIRYTAKEVPAKIRAYEDGKVKVEFIDKVKSITSGQSIVFYVDDCVFGGGIIE